MYVIPTQRMKAVSESSDGSVRSICACVMHANGMKLSFRAIYIFHYDVSAHTHRSAAAAMAAERRPSDIHPPIARQDAGDDGRRCPAVCRHIRCIISHHVALLTKRSSYEEAAGNNHLFIYQQHRVGWQQKHVTQMSFDKIC